jgi:hypothetical protein
VIGDVCAQQRLLDEDQGEHRRGEAIKRFEAFELGLGLAPPRAMS